MNERLQIGLILMSTAHGGVLALGTAIPNMAATFVLLTAASLTSRTSSSS